MAGNEEIGVVLSGGGARGAYQVGVLKAFCEIAQNIGVARPFSIFSGISVGAINSALFASHSEDCQKACAKSAEVWSELHTNQVIHTGALEMGKSATRMIMELTSGKMIKHKKARSLLDNSPLAKLLEEKIDFKNIQTNISKGHLHSLVVTSVNYSDGYNYIFYQTDQPAEPWIRERRVVKKEVITKEHVLASSALPLYFPPQKIGNHYFADGNIRNSTPLSPPIKLGARKLLVIPVTEKEVPAEEHQIFDPTLGRMATVLLNALLLDAVDFDYERLSRINETLSLLPSDADSSLKKIDVCMIRPSENIAQIAFENVDCMPKPLHYFLEGLGTAEETSGLISTLLFEPPFTRKLIDLGYRDGKSRKDEIEEFLTT